MKKWFAICMLTVLVGVALSAEGCSTPTVSRHSGATAQRSSTSTTASTSATGPTNSTAPVTTTVTTAAPSALSLLVEPQAGMTPLYDFMSSARQSLDMTMYELSDPTAEQLLIADHKRGVRVRVLLDHDYSGGSVNQAAYATLSSAGVPVAWANDAEIFHQKTITVDGDESAVMTGNLTPQYYATTRDFVVMDTQAADVAAIESVFATDWSGAVPSPGPPGIDLVWSPGSEPQLAALIGSAARSVVVENEEMDSTSIEGALESDAERGVDVTVAMTADAEWDSAFAQLESDGVHVVLYPDTASALYIHAKVIDVDSTKAFIGSENFSTASLDYNRELGLITSSAGVLGPLNNTLASDIANGQLQPRTGTAVPATTAPSISAPPATSPAAAGCTPIDDEGGCYEPGEYCRDDDHGAAGRAGDGQTITCEDENGTWYWEST
jgi:phosphatidylserine/phosphatidylglycerophosphate/cardiolipin synthase-like enzyme